jgi:hypothetical protein
MNNRSQGSAFPTREQELLLQAALLPEGAALQAWQNWKAQVNLEQELDLGSYRLLSLVYFNLQRPGVDDPWIGKLKGVYRRVWYQNQALFHIVADVLRLFHAAEIETMILKGAALTLLYYRDYGLRPMSDFDVLVPTAKRRAAIDVLTRAGWRPIRYSPEKLTDAVLDVRHALGFENAHQCHFDLHWHVLVNCRYPNADDDFWTGAIPVQVRDVSTRTLDPTDQLLHVCVHGAAWSPVSPIRWVADAMTILHGSHSVIDWARLVAQAEKRRLILPLREALTYLCNSFGAPIPSYILTEMNKARVSDLERKYYGALTAKPNWLGALPVRWFRYLLDLEATGNTNLAHQLVGFPRYLQRVHVLDRRQLLTWAMSRAILRIGRQVRGVDQGLA